jgi:glyoxylase-like metal-dependent hydrolase (beta-lactamase superfamily II)
MSQSSVRIDHNFQGFAGGIASYLIPGDELTLIEAGPASTTPTLLAGIRSAGFDPLDVTRVLLTHIHLDHAGASGILARRLPRARFFVHPKGAKHLIDPSRLVASAERIYGDRMAELWGEIVPVPAERVCVIADGEMVGALRALDTPGHAVHHHAYYDADSATVFTGDVAGVRVSDHRYVRPPTPPPELDLEAWAASIARLKEIGPRRLCLTHFGEYDDVEWHLNDLTARLALWREWIQAGFDAGQDVAALTRALETRERRMLPSDVAERYERVGSYGMCVEGFVRYLTKRAGTGGVRGGTPQ